MVLVVIDNFTGVPLESTMDTDLNNYLVNL